MNSEVCFVIAEPDQGRYVQDIIQALELSGSQVPGELKELWEEYKAQLEAVSSLHWDGLSDVVFIQGTRLS